MEQINKIIEKIEEFAPPTLACAWDNSGWQVNLNNEKTKKIMLCLTCSDEVVKQATVEKCDLIISHHPLIFNKFNSINVERDYSIHPVVLAIKNNIQVYSAHTNLDSCEQGIAQSLAETIGLKDISPILELEKESNLGRVGFIDPKNISLFALVHRLKDLLKMSTINIINRQNNYSDVNKIAVIPGAGGSLISKLNKTDIDVLITGDIRYHNALEATELRVLDVGHFESEIIVIPMLNKLLKDFDVEIIKARESSPWSTYNNG